MPIASWLGAKGWNSAKENACRLKIIPWLASDRAMMSRALLLLLPLVRAAPDWCRWVPYSSLQYVPACSGYAPGAEPGAAVGCASSCEWVPQGAWASTPQCQKCQELYGTQGSGFQGDLCEHWCQWVSRPAWMYTSGCQTCEQELQPKAKAAAAENESKTKSASGVPDWCRWVPYGSQQYVGACSGNWDHGGYEGAYCAGWCVWVPSPSWVNTPDCRRCSTSFLQTSEGVTGCADWCEWVSRPAWKKTSECSLCDADLGTKEGSQPILP